MTISVKWSIEGEEEAAGTIGQWRTKLRNPEPAFEDMLDVIASTQKDWFASKGGGSWAPRSPRYAAYMRRRFPKRGILHGPDRRGHRGLQLRDELTRRPFGVEQVTKSGFVMGTDLPYAIVHQRGLNGLAKRPPLKSLDDKTVQILRKIMQVHIVGEGM